MKSLVLWATSRCNLACRYCYAASVPPEDMKPETVRKAMDLMGDGPYKIQITGGEPLLNPGLVEKILDLASRRNNCRGVSIQTNGTLLCEESVLLLKKYRVAVGISLDGKPETNEALRGKTRQVVEGIRRLGEHRLAANLTCVVTALNAEKLGDIVDMAVYFGNIRGIGLDLLRRAGRAATAAGSGGLKVGIAGAQQLLTGLNGLYRKVCVVNRVLPPGRQIVIREFAKAEMQWKRETSCRDYCYAAQGRSYVVLPNGDCYPCGSLSGDENYRMGNVHTAVRLLSVRCKVPGGCAKCRYAAVCTGGCPSRGQLCGGFDELDCVMKKFAFQIAEKQGGENETYETSETQ